MPLKHLSTLLTDIGLTEHEAAVYLAALHLGSTSIQKIARSAEVKRTTVYSVVDSLIARGLMVKEIKGFKQLFVAEPPEKLEAILDQRQDMLSKLMPELNGLYNLKSEEGTIKYYQGLAGIKSVYEGLIKDIRPHEDYLIISYFEPWVNLDPDFFIDFTKRRAKLPIKIRLLLQDSPVAHEQKKIEQSLNETIRFLPKGTSLNTNLVVIPKKVVIHQLEPPIMAIVIENQSVVRMHQELFEIIWASIK